MGAEVPEQPPVRVVELVEDEIPQLHQREPDLVRAARRRLAVALGALRLVHLARGVLRGRGQLAVLRRLEPVCRGRALLGGGHRQAAAVTQPMVAHRLCAIRLVVRGQPPVQVRRLVHERVDTVEVRVGVLVALGEGEIDVGDGEVAALVQRLGLLVHRARHTAKQVERRVLLPVFAVDLGEVGGQRALVDGRHAAGFEAEALGDGARVAAVVGLQREDVQTVLERIRRALGLDRRGRELAHARRVVLREQPVEDALCARHHLAVRRAVGAPHDVVGGEEADPGAGVARIRRREPPLHVQRLVVIAGAQPQPEERRVVLVRHAAVGLRDGVDAHHAVLDLHAGGPRRRREQRDARGFLARRQQCRLRLQSLALEDAAALELGVLALAPATRARCAEVLLQVERGRRRALGHLRDGFNLQHRVLRQRLHQHLELRPCIHYYRRGGKMVRRFSAHRDTHGCGRRGAARRRARICRRSGGQVHTPVRPRRNPHCHHPRSSPGSQSPRGSP